MITNYTDKNKNSTRIEILKERYLLGDKNGKIIEKPDDMFRRVAKAVSRAEEKYGRSKNEVKKFEEIFYKMMVNSRFLPNSPTLMNAGTEMGQLSACFVLPVEDSLDSIFKTLCDMAKIQQSGGGTGFNFSRLRMKGDIVKSTGGVASGPVSFMKIYDMTTDVIKQGGKRRGANMGILNFNHPDIDEFINIKNFRGNSLNSLNSLRNFNISVAATDKFMNDAEENKDYMLINPGDNKPVGKVNANKIFNEICTSAWQTGDPGLIFIDEINKKHPLKQVIESTNPCGELLLLPYEACNLGSINLTKMLKKKDERDEKYIIDWELFEKTIRNSVRFLDCVIDVNKFPLQKIKTMVLKNRKIGLGVMGFAEMLIMMKISYNSRQALKIADKTGKFLRDISIDESQKIGVEKGSFPGFKFLKNEYKNKYSAMRNATTLSIAPTGTISIIANTSSGIEPLFAICYKREILDGRIFVEINRLFLDELIKRDLYTDELFNKILSDGNLKNVSLPADIKKIYATAYEIPYEQHIKMQATFQKYVDNAVSKTINFPENSSVEDVKNAYILAWKMKCKGITVYRNKSKEGQVLYPGGCCNIMTS